MLSHITVHHEKLLAHLLDVMDPQTDGGIGDLKSHLDDLMDVTTPGGLKELLDHINPSS